MKQDNSKNQSFSFRKRIASFRHAFNGIRLAISNEHNMRIHLFAALLAIGAGFYFQLTFGEWIVLVFAIGFVFAAELFNSAIESIADFISPGHHIDIGKIKDLAAGAVLVSAIAAIIAGILIFWPHIKLLMKI
jgi:diacylglycerol kinase (ATP)